MSSQDQIQDEIFARQLQEEEYQEQRRQTQDAQYARQLSTGAPNGADNRFALQTGQTAMVRLHHPLTARQIGEVMFAHYVSHNVMCFELAGNRGKYLRATSSGTVEFTTSTDDKTKFIIENVPGGGTLYLMNKNYATKINTSRVPGWYLSMSREGVLSSNGAKNEFAQWALIAAVSPNAVPPTPSPLALPPPAPAPLQSIARANSSSLPPPAQQPQYAPQRESLSLSPSGAGDFEMQPMASGEALTPTDNPMLSHIELPAVAASAALASAQSPPPHQHTQQQQHQPQQQQPTQQYVAPPLARASSAVAASAVMLFAGHDAGRDALMKFFLTPTGLQFLQQPAYQAAYVLYVAGALGKILHRPDWPVAAKRFKDYVKMPYPALDAPLADAALSFADKKAFFELGYTVARGAVPLEMVQRVLRLSHYWLNKHLDAPKGASHFENVRKTKSRVELCGAITTDPDLLALYYETALAHIVSQLIGAGDVASPYNARIVSVSPTLDLPADYSSTLSVEHSTQLPGDRWTIDGFDGNGGHSPYNILVGVALTDTLLPNEGNFAVHGGSQMVLMEAFKAQALNRSSLFSEDPLLYKKPDLGPPEQLLLRAGDAVLCTQRLAVLNAPNTSSAVQSMVFFRVSHVDHEVLRGPALDGLWLEFRGSDQYMGDERAPGPAQSAGSASAAGTSFLDDLMSMPAPAFSHLDNLMAPPAAAPGPPSSMSAMASPAQSSASNPFDDLLDMSSFSSPASANNQQSAFVTSPQPQSHAPVFAQGTVVATAVGTHGSSSVPIATATAVPLGNNQQNAGYPTAVASTSLV